MKKKTEISAGIAGRIERVFADHQRSAPQIAATTTRQRVKKLRYLLNWIYDHRQAIHEAVYSDFRKPAAEADLTEVWITASEIKLAIRHLKKWMKPRRVPPTLPMLTTRAEIQFVPRGQVLIISPWNYPFLLAAAPLASAIAAGNVVCLKPSEISPHTSALLRQMAEELFPENEVAVFEGGKETAAALLKKPFNHIYYTGNPQVGKIVMKAAAENLSSVTLEMGGKSPVIVDRSADVQMAAAKIIWGKLLNAGQSCVAPDYVLVHRDVAGELVKQMKAAAARYLSAGGPQASPDYARIVDDRHFGRLEKLVEDARNKSVRLEMGGYSDSKERFIEPAILVGEHAKLAVMEEEIFGPLLPVLPYDSLDQALEILAEQEKPLGVYIFSRERSVIRRIICETRSGGVCVNDLMIQFFHLNLPFGGVNHSGFGNSHGWYGFRAFSHERAVLRQGRFSPLQWLYPPYTPRVQKLIDLVLRWA